MKLNKKGFTLIELLGVIVIIGLIIAGTTYGLIKLIDRSKEEKMGISISSIKETASVYANENNNDEDYWNEITRPGYEGKYFCVTIEELMNKGLLDKNIDLSDLGKNKNITKTTYVGIKKDLVTLTNGRAMLLNNIPSLDDMNNLSEEQKMYGICTGNIINETITKPISLTGGDSYTDEIYDIEFSEIEGENIEIDKSKCYYSETSGKFSNEGEITDNKCNINSLKDNTDYYVRICTYTKGGSSSCADKSITTKEVPKPTITLSDKVNITYNTDNINGASYYYFKSTISGTSSINVSSCTINNNTFTCNNDSTTNITGNTWYKSPSTNVSISYSTNGTGVVEARTYDKSNNFNENSKEFSVYKITFNKGDADKIGGVASNVDKLCLAAKNGNCNITSPSIEKEGYSIIGWNTDSSASTSTWNVGVSKSINSDGIYYPVTKKADYYVYIQFNTQGGTVTSSTTTDSGNVYNWSTDSNGLISRTDANGSTYSSNFFKIAYGSETASDGLPNYNYSKYLNITKTGYSAVSGAEWKCMSGCTISDKTFDQSIAYSSSDFCDAQNNNCTAVLGVNWAANSYTISYSLGGGSYGTNHPTSGTYDNTVTISNPTRTGYTFTGWKITGMDSVTHTYGSSTTTATSISSTKATSFKNLRSTSGTVTFTALWEDTTEPTISMSKSSSTTLCKGATVKLTCSDSGSGMQEAYMNDNGTVTTGTSTTSQSFNTTRSGNISTYVKCTDKAGNVSSKTYYYTVVYKYSCKCPYCPSGYSSNGSRCYKTTTTYASCILCSNYDNNYSSCISSDYCIYKQSTCAAALNKNGCHSCPSGYSITSSFTGSTSTACYKTTYTYKDYSYTTSDSSSSCSSSCTQTTRSCSS
ncbi:MAG: InlB B-repeat-containing protein [Bacilli bacterium]